MALGGIEPEVVIDSPTGGGELTGEQIILWTITDGDSQEHMARVLYSPDGGESQHVLGWGTPLNRMVVDFDDLPGCQMNCQVQVLVSDGANTGSAILTGFTVPSKTPTAEIVFPDTDQAFKVGEMVWLQGVGWDPEDGVVSGASMTWSSDIDGLLGTGVDLPIADLGEGLHTISLTVNDTHGNSATDAITVHIDGTAPVLSLFVRRDEVPSRCVDAKIGAFDESGGSGLAKVEYSLDGGESWMGIPLANLPFEFTVPGSGYIHLVSHAIDTAGNFSYEDLPFTISEPCAPQNKTPVADAGGPYSVDEGGSVRLDGSTSNDPDGNIVLYEWDLDADNEYDDAQGETVDIAFGDNGTFTVALLVTDNQGETDTDSAEVIVSNLMPEVALDTSYAILIKDQEVFIGRAGETQGHRAESIDPGSDDLTFTWSFGPTTTYFSNGVSPDPFPSPDGEFPFYAEDNAQTTFEKPGVYEIGVVVEDDDGDSAEVSVIKLIVGQFLCPQSQGFWKHQVSAKGKPHVDESTLLSYLEMIAWASSYFGDKESLESLDDARDVMEIKGPGMRSKAEAQLLAAWLNFTSGSIGWEEIIDTDADGELDMPFYEIVQRVETILLLEQPTHDERVKAKDLAEAVNKSSKGQNACDE